MELPHFASGVLVLGVVLLWAKAMPLAIRATAATCISLFVLVILDPSRMYWRFTDPGCRVRFPNISESLLSGIQNISVTQLES
jgi:hypothetical protein